ncbi:MAG TPA: FAD-binding domain-containing protein [Quisquiliibacterium sp.]|nr:FAD-binding domain-containing protein [Quisquiliibacterium sp.]
MHPGAHSGVELPAPTRAAALARIAAIDPDRYARTRNHLHGAVSGLSPYLTHGLVSLPEVLAGVRARHAIGDQHKFVFELGWRAYFRHVWSHRADGIFTSLHPGPLPDEAYACALPPDLAAGRTGVPAIDRAVHALLTTGTLHNHARMWLASYTVHLRKVHWRTGADWMVAHLLDGDLASNHLSWQWVAGTASHKPYLFNADNVARFAPADWHSPGSVLDAGYEAMERRARTRATFDGLDGLDGHDGHDGRDGRDGRDPRCCDRNAERVEEPALYDAPPAWLAAVPPDPADVRGCDVWLVHPWALGDVPSDLPAGTRVLGVCVSEFHRAWPWSARRWSFVGARMAALAPVRWSGPVDAIAAALATARSVQTLDDPHLSPWLRQWARVRAAPALFPEVDRRCDSFSKWWSIVRGPA